MAYEQTFEHFNQLNDLFETFPYDRAWLDSAFREPGRARAFVEEAAGDQLVLLCLESGDCFMAGNISTNKVEVLLNYVFSLEKPQTINYISLPEESWGELITREFPQEFTQLPRVQLEFDDTRFQKAKKTLPTLPRDFELTRIDLVLAKRIGPELDPDFEEFWPNPESFLVRGAGLCITRQEQIVSVAYSAFAPYRIFEVAIATHQNFRGRGLASIVSAALIEECLKREQKPHWSTEAENQASRRTGKKLGFGNEQHYMWLKYNHNSLNGKKTQTQEERMKVEDQPDEADLKFLEDSLSSFNRAKTGIFDDRNLAIFIRDESGQIIAGLSGWTWGGCLAVENLWVREDQRNQGYGKRLLAAAEKEAIARQCFQAILDTHSFQAPDFYQKLDYEIAGTIKDHPKGSYNYLLRKSLV